MWFEEVGNDLYTDGFQENKLALLMKINETHEITIQNVVNCVEGAVNKSKPY
jgi:hypothetical protein